MVLNAYFVNVYVPNVQDALTVVQSTKFGLQMEGDGVVEVFANNDKVLQLDHHDHWIEVDALTLGVSTIRIMGPDLKIQKDLVVTVSDTIARPATSLNTSFAAPEPK